LPAARLAGAGGDRSAGVPRRAAVLAGARGRGAAAAGRGRPLIRQRRRRHRWAALRLPGGDPRRALHLRRDRRLRGPRRLRLGDRAGGGPLVAEAGAGGRRAPCAGAAGGRNPFAKGPRCAGAAQGPPLALTRAMEKEPSLDRLLVGRVERALEGALARATAPGCPPRLAQALREAVLSGGSRVRPQLCLLTAIACGDAHPALAESAACALELLHCASLVHDDLPCFDDADTRRGRPSIHRAFGQPLAVLVGDALIVAAFETLARAAVEAPIRAGQLA